MCWLLSYLCCKMYWIIGANCVTYFCQGNVGILAFCLEDDTFDGLFSEKRQLTIWLNEPKYRLILYFCISANIVSTSVCERQCMLIKIRVLTTYWLFVEIIVETLSVHILVLALENNVFSSCERLYELTKEQSKCTRTKAKEHYKSKFTRLQA